MKKKRDKDNTDDKFKQEVTYSSPNLHGAVRGVAYYFDENDNRCERDKASKMQILEFDENDVCVFSIIGTCEKRRHLPQWIQSAINSIKSIWERIH